MSGVKNVLFIMCDQLRADTLSCYGGLVDTPHIDRLAARGVRFSRAYVQAGVCGPSRMSFYTGRYPFTHGATWNFVPLPIGELTLGDHLAASGRTLSLIGKTHVVPDTAAMALRGIELQSEQGLMLREGGFAAVCRHEGDLPTGKAAYAAYLNGKGYAGADPWTDYAVAVRDEDGTVSSGWHMRNVHRPALIRAEDSETAFITDEAIDFIRRMADTPWVLHLSYIKPHWPYAAPAPYHALYRDRPTGPILRSEIEEETLHPVVRAFRDAHRECRSFARAEVARHVRPAYFGLVKEIDDHLGRLFAEMDRLGRSDDTMIVFTSDHGDFLGDHGLGEKELFYEQAQRVPMIVVDPDSAAAATRGTVDHRFVEAVDVAPTIVEALGQTVPQQWIEGRSLLPLTRGEAVDWRDAVFSEIDYAFRGARLALGRAADACRGFMVRTDRWKYVAWQGFRPQLFDLDADPDEFRDLAAGDAPQEVIRAHQDRLHAWMMGSKRRTTLGIPQVEAMNEAGEKFGIIIGQW